ncbi:MAG: transposase [Candidatus Electrothrix sp. GW3-4]|uniref:transposase n=1 Tax=Candidatus Electrothrix sp. GW3-4 TaxID=3126740 RepID=UPI0030D0A707
MSKIPTNLTPAAFEEYVAPYLSKAKRGYTCSIPLYKVFNYILYFLYTGCQWEMIPIDKDPNDPDKLEISWQAIYHHFRKWSNDGSLKKLWNESVESIRSLLNLSELNLDGTHTIAKKGGKSAKYQGRKKAKTTNILPLLDKNGYPIASTEIIAGNHNDAFELENNIRYLFKEMKHRKLPISGSYFNADSAFDTKGARKVCFNNGVIPNIAENKRGRKKPKRGRKRLFDEKIYKNRFGTERTWAWVDELSALRAGF